MTIKPDLLESIIMHYKVDIMSRHIVGFFRRQGVTSFILPSHSSLMRPSIYTCYIDVMGKSDYRFLMNIAKTTGFAFLKVTYMKYTY